MTSAYAEYSQNAKPKTKWSRDDVSTKIIDFKECKKALTQREFARQTGVPRTTLQHWLTRMDKIDEDPLLVSFFESPVGVNFLHTLILGLHFEFTKVGCASIHNISNFYT
nr:helix-turn-helix transcriptional regulator [uncultured Desulfobacter sp.]